jgi:hypothetical protein
MNDKTWLEVCEINKQAKKRGNVWFNMFGRNDKDLAKLKHEQTKTHNKS